MKPPDVSRRAAKWRNPVAHYIFAKLTFADTPRGCSDDVPDGTLSNRIVDHFTYTRRNSNEMENENEDVQWEFLVIGRRVLWNEAQAICSIYGHLNPLSVSEKEEMEYDNSLDLVTRETKTDTGSTLAVLDDDTKDWLARMISESDYRYDGLWIGGQRKDVNSNWTWIDTQKKGNTLISNPMIIEHPAFYVADNDRNGEKNCLVFERLNHDTSVLVPENCRHQKPFICMRPGKKKSTEKIVEGNSVFVDDQRYTLYQIIDEEDNKLRTEGVRKVNGGGITWRDARLECKKRSKHLAMIFTNEAATAIANAMLHSRPSMESLWLGGHSIDGIDWTWISSGVTLPSKKSNITLYPPWLDGHPVLSSENVDYHQRRCLILDRHLCAERTTPVFLDLDCKKKRPFVCQDDIPERMKDDERDILLDNKHLVFSRNKMTWIEGEAYCQRNFGRVASVQDAKTLSVVLEKMTELALDHIWVGGRTVMSKDGWKWVDENGETLSRNDLGADSSWCLDKNGSSWPYADREICLNLDREDHGTPLFYGLPCNATNQYVLCNYLSTRRSMQSTVTEINRSKFAKSTNIQQQAADLAERIRKLAREDRSGLLFVMDDSLSVLNAQFAEEMKLATTIIRRYFPLSHNHPIGMVIFSEKSKVVFPLNQTDACSSLHALSKDMIENRANRINQDREGVVGKTTNLISAALTSVDVVRTSKIQRVIMVFVTDGEHMVEGNNNKENLHVAVESLQNLRNDGHEAIAIVISQGQKHMTDYNVIEELFSISLKGERNLYFVKDYDGLAEMNLALNSTDWKEDYAAECGEIQWIIPKDIELLAHLLQSRK